MSVMSINVDHRFQRSCHPFATPIRIANAAARCSWSMLTALSDQFHAGAHAQARKKHQQRPNAGGPRSLQQYNCSRRAEPRRGCLMRRCVVASAIPLQPATSCSSGPTRAGKDTVESGKHAARPAGHTAARALTAAGGCMAAPCPARRAPPAPPAPAPGPSARKRQTASACPASPWTGSCNAKASQRRRQTQQAGTPHAQETQPTQTPAATHVCFMDRSMARFRRWLRRSSSCVRSASAPPAARNRSSRSAPPAAAGASPR